MLLSDNNSVSGHFDTMLGLLNKIKSANKAMADTDTSAVIARIIFFTIASSLSSLDATVIAATNLYAH